MCRLYYPLVLASVFFAATSRGQEAPEPLQELKPSEFKVGQVGQFPKQNDKPSETGFSFFQVMHIAGPNEMLIREIRWRGMSLSRGNTPALERGSVAAQSAINRAINEARTANDNLPDTEKWVIDVERGTMYQGKMFPYYRISGESFWLKGRSTVGLVDNRPVKLEGGFKVVGTKKHPLGTRTVFLVEAESEAERLERERREIIHLEKQRVETERRNEETRQRDAAADKATAERKAREATERATATAAAKVALARQYIDLGKKDVAKTKLQEVLRDYPKTKAAEEAQSLLKKL